MRLTKSVPTAAIALIAPIGVGYAITASAAVGAGGGGEPHEVDQFTTDGYVIDREQSDGLPATVVVTDADGDIVGPNDYDDLPQEVADLLNEVSDDEWEPVDSFGLEGAWNVDGDEPCYNPIEPGGDITTTGDEGAFHMALDIDGQWIQEPVYFSPDAMPSDDVLYDASQRGAAFELDGAQPLEPCD